MKHPLTVFALGAALLLSLPAHAADIDWNKVDAALGKTAAVSAKFTAMDCRDPTCASRWTASPSSQPWRWRMGGFRAHARRGHGDGRPRAA